MKKVVKDFTNESDKETVREILKKKTPMIVRFYASWCPACKASKSKWNTFCQKEAPKGYSFYSFEEKSIPEELLESIGSFPTYAVFDKKGPRHIGGHPPNLLQELDLTD